MLLLEDSRGNDCHIKALKVSRLIQLLLEIPSNSWIVASEVGNLVFYRESLDFSFGNEQGMIDFAQERIEKWED